MCCLWLVPIGIQDLGIYKTHIERNLLCDLTDLYRTPTHCHLCHDRVEMAVGQCSKDRFGVCKSQCYDWVSFFSAEVHLFVTEKS